MKKGPFVDSVVSILIENKFLTLKKAKDLKYAFKGNSKETLDNFLLDEGLVDKEDLLFSLSEYYEISYFDPMGHFFDHKLLKKFPKAFLLRNMIIPLEVDENILVFIAGNPKLPDLLSKIGEYVSYDIRFNVGLTRDIIDSINEFYDVSPNKDLNFVDEEDEY